MRRLSLALLGPLLLVFATSIQAQTRVSLMAGANLASLDFDTDDLLVPNLQSVTRLSAGIAVTIPASDRFGIQLGGSYSQKGGRLSGEVEGVTLTSDLKMDYVELTVLAQLALARGERVSAHLLVGPALALQASCGVTVSAREGDASFGGSTSCADFRLDSKAYDFGLAGGGGLEIGLTDSLAAGIGLVYTLGLSSVSGDRSDTVRTRALALRAGLSFPIG